ncbi:MAG: DNA primase large subunit PriL [Thaumarchaeota archaeon]|nr:DNA primase large subunit PriL [Candidatus Calditenuaceae archaeon]MDW8186442.1 DNA primase large subunit PriL [Nitrososphaerota archaeon]
MASDPTREFYVNSKLFMAKYPFVSGARDYVSKYWGSTVEELSSSWHSEAVDAAVRRVVEAVEKGEDVGEVRLAEDLDAEILSFPVALMLVASLGDRWLARRWSLYESRRVERLLADEDDQTLLHVLTEELSIECGVVESSEEERKGGLPYKIKLRDYLRLVKGIDGTEWRLVNRTVNNGWVYVSRRELIRVAAEEVESRTLKRVVEVGQPKVPSELMTRLEAVRSVLLARAAKREPHGGFRGEGSWPPCMRALKQSLVSGGKVGHFGNFAIAAFLLSIGYTVDDVIGIYSQRADFNERIARYQTEHIAGLKGSRTKYWVPSCQTMRAHGLCIEQGRLCPASIKNPRQYARLMKAGSGGNLNVGRREVT